MEIRLASLNRSQLDVVLEIHGARSSSSQATHPASRRAVPGAGDLGSAEQRRAWGRRAYSRAS
jgi:hypothetical protein